MIAAVTTRALRVAESSPTERHRAFSRLAGSPGPTHEKEFHMRVLVAYTSRHGATQGIAERIA